MTRPMAGESSAAQSEGAGASAQQDWTSGGGNPAGWQESTTSLKERAASILKSGALGDATIIVQGQEGFVTFLAHKLILAMSSSVLEAKVCEEPGPITMKIPYTSPGVFQKLLDYIYKDELMLSSLAEAWDVWKLARKLQIKHLADKTREYLVNGLTPDNALDCLMKAALYGDEELQLPCFQVIGQHAEHVMQKDEFSELSEDLALKIITSPHLKASNIAIFNAAAKWAKGSGKSDDETVQQRFGLFKPHIKYEGLTSEELSQNVMLSGVLSNRELIQLMGGVIARMNISPTKEKEAARVPGGPMRQITCCRSVNMAMTRVQYSPFGLKFRVVKCPSSCLFTGFQVTEYYGEYDIWGCGPFEIKSFQLICIVQDRKSGDTVFPCPGNILRSPFKITFDSPLKLKEGSECHIQVTMQDNGQKSLISTSSHCLEKFTCEDLEIEFIDIADHTNQLVPNLFFSV